MMDQMSGMMGGMGIIGILIVILIALAIAALVKYLFFERSATQACACGIVSARANHRTRSLATRI